jgi:hypothetical protein
MEEWSPSNGQLGRKTKSTGFLYLPSMTERAPL